MNFIIPQAVACGMILKIMVSSSTIIHIIL